MKPYLKIETEFNTALAILKTVQTIFTMPQDAPPNDEIIFWTIEGAKRELERAKKHFVNQMMNLFTKQNCLNFSSGLEQATDLAIKKDSTTSATFGKVTS